MPAKKQILICDDQEGIRESLNLILSNHYDVDLTANAIEAIDYLNTKPTPDLICLDIKMPKVDGLEALKQIKKRHPDIKVLIITGYQSVEIASEAIKIGASGYIVKPFVADEILTIVHETLSK